MNWIVYWFMFPVCMAIATAAMFSGISGAALLFFAGLFAAIDVAFLLAFTVFKHRFM